MKNAHDQAVFIGVQRQGQRQLVQLLHIVALGGEFNVKALHGILPVDGMLHLGGDAHKKPTPGVHHLISDLDSPPPADDVYAVKEGVGMGRNILTLPLPLLDNPMDPHRQ